MKHSRPLILLALAALLPLILLSALIGVAWLRQQQREMESSALERVRRVTAVLERELASQIDLLRVLSESPLLDADLNETAVLTMLERSRRQMPQWRFVSLSDREGNRLVDAPAPVSGVRGKVVDPISHSELMRTAEPQIGSVTRGPGQTLAFAVRVPVIRDGRAFRALSAVVRPDAIAKLLGSNVPDGWRGSVIDSEGRLVARTYGDPDLLGRPASPHSQSARARASEGVYESVSLEGDNLFVAFRMVPRWNWSVHVAIPQDLYNRPLIDSLWLMGIGGILSILLAGSFVALLGREAEARRRAAATQEENGRMEALGRMTGGVAHDFNNLMMIAQGAAEAIKRRRADPERVVAFADSILTAIRRGEAMTRQLLAFARRSPQEPLCFRLQDRSADLLALLESSIRADIVLSLTIPEECWPVYADPNALDVALVNLVVNARDAMPSGGRIALSVANVTLSHRRDPKTSLSGDFVAIAVQDTGSGIPDEDLGRIFEPFFTTKSAEKGTGLGLSQVMGFARQSGGAVTVTSKLGTGTTVTLLLPRGSGEPVHLAATSEPPSQPEPELEPVQESFADNSILLIEDNPEVAEAVDIMLTSVGFQVHRVANGVAALDLLNGGERIDAVLSDIILGTGPTGLDLVPHLRERLPGVPIVLMTGYSEALVAGIPQGLPVITKPFRQPELVTALRAAGLSANRTAAGVRRAAASFSAGRDIGGK